MLPAPLQLYESAIQCKSSSRVLMLQAAHSLILTFEQRDEQLKSFSSRASAQLSAQVALACPGNNVLSVVIYWYSMRL